MNGLTLHDHSTRPWRNVPPHLARDLRPHLPAVIDEAATAIRRQVPEYARPAYDEVLRGAVDHAIRHFVDLIADPDTPWDDTLGLFRDIGYGEAREGRTLDAWDTALRLGARLAVRALGEASDRLGITRTALGDLAEAIFAYLEVLAEAAARGHAEAAARAAAERRHRRRRLVDLLISGTATPQALADQARLARWPLPRTLCAVALHERGHGPYRPPALPGDVLADLDRRDPCVLVPEPDGRRAVLAAAGPPVEPVHAARSLHWARRALDLARRGVLPADRLVHAADHLPALAVMHCEDLVARVTELRLAPLLALSPSRRERLARTLLECLRCGFNATEVAGRLQVHPQTVRYRLHQLEGLLGDTLHDPDRRLELEIALFAWLTTGGRVTDSCKTPRPGPA
ncbi:PucR family transcriptional regulator [Thermomonospora cellulosilytica]|uniref:PucR family transcriptional regulator n=1 Tax=Thermomonospora cellulosilytica TaxID=1411118 RepID=A0A7W3RBN8_9ACTN|nr:helix-turn-helix domain-containing protein [Thermomonospora cellulosilytica]MBA9006435.1 hypothetical protein [Thermomonospora cellulosilytica]